MHPYAIEEYSGQIKHAIQGHLRWVLVRAARPHGFWHRSYLVTGKPKDQPIFQLDQQCYPILELCEYLYYFPEEINFVRKIAENGTVSQILSILASKRDEKTGLWPTDETPGDDAVEYPFHFSSHVLLWRTFTQLAGLCVKLGGIPGLKEENISSLAADLRSRSLNAFLATHPGRKKRIFAYLTNGTDQCTFYHDANDVPTLFAPEWGFLETPDELSAWENTMDFALSPHNSLGFCSEGPYHGLGSVHSPGSWVLGYFQELGYALATDRMDIAGDVWKRIQAAMQWDGTFSEAVDPQTARCTSKAWFSWPGSMIGALIVQMKISGQESKLVARL
jgi:uncharacterized protein